MERDNLNYLLKHLKFAEYAGLLQRGYSNTIFIRNSWSFHRTLSDQIIEVTHGKLENTPVAADLHTQRIANALIK